MIIAILGSITAIAALCWLLFTLAIYALPALGGVAAGMWAYQTGAGLPGSVLVGLVGAGLVFGLAQFLILFARPMWVKLAVALAFVAPAAVAGFHATQAAAAPSVSSISQHGRALIPSGKMQQLAAVAVRTAGSGEAGVDPIGRYETTAVT